MLTMRRITISVNDELADEFDRLLVQRGYQNRSEAFRDLVRGALEADRLSSDTATHCVACLSYIYNHHERDLAARVTAAHHAHHDVSVATMHVHLDHDHCLEAAILRGPTAEVKRFSQALIAERGVRHGQINLVPVEVGHSHQHHSDALGHSSTKLGNHSHPHDHRSDRSVRLDADQASPDSGDSTPHVHIHPKT
jgi:CopG family transcriptional regulator, nickel-responsive regulator